MTYILTRAQTDLVVSLVRAHKTNMEGHRKAIEQMDNLAEIAAEGYRHAAREIGLCDDVLAELGAVDD